MKAVFLPLLVTVSIHFHASAQQPATPVNPGNGMSDVVVDPSPSPAPPTQRIDRQATFPGGQEGLQKFLSKNLRYPAEAQAADVKGRVFVHFTVDEEGVIHEPSILRGLGSGCDEEALRLVKAFPKWKPAQYEGKPVTSTFNLVIFFPNQ